MDLSNYVRVAAYDLPEPTRTSAPSGNLLAQEASGVTYNWDTNTLFIVGDGGTSVTQVSLTGQLIDTMTLAAGNSPQQTTFYDTESITYVGNGKFVFTEERDRQIVEFTYAAGTTLTREAAKTVDLGTNIGNVGLEGVTWDPYSGGFVLVKEKDPESIFQTGVDFNAGTATNGSSTTVNSINLFDPALIGTTDLSDVYSLSSNASFIGTTQESHLLILSQESGKIVEVGRDGTVYSSLQLVAPTTSTGISLQAMTVEGLTMGPDGTIYLVSEEGGGDFNHPQLWVYKPAVTTPNTAPTGVTLSNPTAALLENSNTSAPIKVADIAIADDGQGTNTISLSGADASAFEVSGTALYLKAGTTLDYEAKKSYAVTVNVDDVTVGSTPDASVNYVLNVTNIVNEGANGSVAITEIAPWSSGTSNVGSDWFELTNTGATAINLAGWKMDDNSYSNASAVALSGVSSIAAGESVIYLEVSGNQTAAGVIAAFKATWFGGNVPAGLQIGTYSGSGVGLSGSGDAVSVFDSTGALKASVAFGTSPTSPLATFDNTAQANSTSLTNHVTISGLSAVGTNGAFAAANDGTQIGSPGSAGGVPAPVNQAPTAVGLTGEITTISDDTNTTARVKLASVIVNDDGLGTNTLYVSGADASFFEVDSTGLYLKAGVTLDATTKAHYDVVVNVDDVTVGSTPDASVSFALDLTHVQAASVRVTEVAPWSSGNSPFAADWFEVTNTGGSAVNITGWKVDDSSNAFASAVALNGITNIAAGESVIFVEGDATTAQALIATWFGGNPPAGLQVGYYSGAGIGLSTGGDAVNIFNASGVLQANVTFGSSPASAPYATFDNAAGVNGAISGLSSVGVNGGFVAAQDSAEIGSPGSISTPAQPENEAPTAVTLSNVVGTLAENTSTATRLKVADVAITDDGLGTNLLSLSGADASFFEVDSTGLYIKAGTGLDYETKANYAVTVNVDDPTVGTTPDASTSYTLTLTDVDEGPAPQIRITEVAPWSSGNGLVGADWFELTNTGTTAVDISGWKMDDNSFSFGSAVALNGVTTIAAGQSVIFLESASASIIQTFINTWFGGTAPANVLFGTYTGSGVGLSTGGDGVAIYNASGVLQAKVSFGASPASAPYATFDNAAGLDNVTLTTLTTVGTNGGFVAAGDVNEIGSPGTIVTPNSAPVANDDTGTALVEDSVLNATGNVVANDTDADNDVLTVAGIRAGTEAAGGAFTALSGATVVHGLYGDLTINADGSYSYALANSSAAVQALEAGQHVSDVFSYQVTDTKGATDIAQLSFDIGGAYDGPPIITGTEAADTINGTSAAEIILGLGGNDKLFGLDGDDVLNGGLGADTLDGGNGIDTVSYADATSGVALSLLKKKGTVGEANGDKFVSIENILGSHFADSLEGDRNANVIHGGAGDDIIIGNGGADQLFGDAGNDRFVIGTKDAGTIDGGEGIDTVEAGGNNVKINMAANSFTGIEVISSGGYHDVTIVGDKASDDVIDLSGYTLVGITEINGLDGNDTITGSAGADVILGDKGDDVLNGGDGNDVLIGGKGLDTLTGGAGADRFVFGKAESGKTLATADIITDFLLGTDLIDLSSMDANTKGGTANDAFVFIGTDVFTKTAGQLRYEHTTDGVAVIGDTNGDGKADFMIHLLGVDTLAANAFIL